MSAHLVKRHEVMKQILKGEGVGKNSFSTSVVLFENHPLKVFMKLD
jgi:hypothetical protein